MPDSGYTPSDCPDCDGQGVVMGSDRLLLCSRCDASGDVI